MDSRFQVLDSGFYLCRFHIPKHKRFQILVSGLLLISAFHFLGMTPMANFIIERTCCVNACLSFHISITTFDNYKKYITENQGINFSSTNTYWDCPFIPCIFSNSEWAYHISFIEVPRGSSRFFKWFSSIKRTNNSNHCLSFLICK